ncbi:MAG: hypothetical protein QNL02_19980 [Paracoccaceae bacterium]
MRGRHDHLRVGFDGPEVSHPRQSKQLQDFAKALFDAKALFGDQLA